MLVKQNTSRKTRGFTLTEAAIVLGIVGLILGAIWVAAGAVYRNQRVNTTTTQIMQIVNGIRSLYNTQTTVEAGVTAIILKSAGAVPSDMEDSATPGAVKNVWGADVTIAGTGSTNFTITYNDVPDAPCARLLTGLTGVNRDTGLNSVKGIAAAAFPITATTAVAACNAGTNVIVFDFELRS